MTKDEKRNAAYRNSSLSKSALLVYIFLLDHACSEGRLFSRREIGAGCHMEDSAVSRALRNLQESSLIGREIVVQKGRPFLKITLL